MERKSNEGNCPWIKVPHPPLSERKIPLSITLITYRIRFVILAASPRSDQFAQTFPGRKFIKHTFRETLPIVCPLLSHHLTPKLQGIHAIASIIEWSGVVVARWLLPQTQMSKKRDQITTLNHAKCIFFAGCTQFPQPLYKSEEGRV